ncbi:MAG: DUF4085 family protein [Planctomycetia bacterium]|nr:DUF4085 family protein [Planctomycetia bacterium]
MRFFTKEWLTGELSDEAFDAIPDAYSIYLASLKLPSDVFALSKVDIHDGRLLDVKYNSESAQLLLRLRCGDQQTGYYDLHITYSDLVLDSASLSVLNVAMRAPKDEFLYDEIDRTGDNFEHRCILASHNEVRIKFSHVVVNSCPLDSRESP